MYTIYEQQFDECHALYEQGKYAECVELGEYNLTDAGMSQYLRIKNHCVLAGAADGWRQAEKYRVTAERAYRLARDKVEGRKANPKPDDPSLIEEIEGLKGLRTNLDNVCKYQAKYAPDDYSIKDACYPLREGRVEDLIALRRSGQGWMSEDEEDGEKHKYEKDNRKERKDLADRTRSVVHTGEEDKLEDMLGKLAMTDHDGGDILSEVQSAKHGVSGNDLDTSDTVGKVIVKERRKGECICRCGGCF